MRDPFFCLVLHFFRGRFLDLEMSLIFIEDAH